MTDFRSNLRSPRYDTCVGKPLTDRKILHYILAGRYGEPVRQRALQEFARKKEKKENKKERVKKQNDISLALKLLCEN